MGDNLNQRVKDAANGGGPGTAVAERPAPTLAGSIREMSEQFQAAMPRGVEATQLVRDALTALRTTRHLAECDRASVLGGLMTCAQLGLRPGVLGHAWLLPFYDRNLITEVDGKRRSGGYRAQLVIGYQGYVTLAHRTGQIGKLVAREVHANDVFEIEYGLADNLIHKPLLDADRGDVIGYYAAVWLQGGLPTFLHMTRAEVEAHRDRFAMAKKDGKVVGPWRDHFDEMAKKTCFLKLAKWLPKSTELQNAIAADETVRVDLAQDAITYGQKPDIDAEVVDDEQGTD